MKINNNLSEFLIEKIEWSYGQNFRTLKFDIFYYVRFYHSNKNIFHNVYYNDVYKIEKQLFYLGYF